MKNTERFAMWGAIALLSSVVSVLAFRNAEARTEVRTERIVLVDESGRKVGHIGRDGDRLVLLIRKNPTTFYGVEVTDTSAGVLLKSGPDEQFVLTSAR